MVKLLRSPLLLLLILLWACEKEVDIDIDQTKPKLVVNALFNTDSTWKIELSKSKYILDTARLQFVNDALVMIRNSAGHNIPLTNQENGIYTAATSPQIGEVYTLEVKHPVLDDIFATSSLPGNVIIESITVGGERNLNEFWGREVRVTFNDGPDVDHYLLQVQGAFWEYEYDQWFNIIDSQLYYYPLDFMTEDLVASGLNKDYFSALSFEDDVFNGNSYTLEILVDNYLFMEKSGLDGIFISLSLISQEYYWYQTSYQNYLNAQGNFLAQPVQVYTNIANGLGVFAGYSTSRDSILIQ